MVYKVLQAARESRSARPDQRANRRIAIGVSAVFITQFVSFLFINARNIAQPGIISEFDGMALFSWLIALSALAGSASTLVFGKLSDLYGRRTILLSSIGMFALGLAIAASAPTMPIFIAATTFMSLGHWPIIPLSFIVIGDLFTPAERAKWTGLLSMASGLAALVGPVVGGVIAESAVGWRGLYWGTIPLMLCAGGLIATGLPARAQKVRPSIDFRGTFLMVVATTTLMVGVSWLGAPGRLGMGAVLLAISLAAWVAFVRTEKRAKAPILDPQIFSNRTFMTIAGIALLSSVAYLGIGAYSPIFVQSVMGIDPTMSGSMLTPYATIFAFLGIPVGFLLARSKRYNWIYLVGLGIATAGMLGMWRLNAASPAWMYVLITSVVGLGIGAIPMVNTLVAQLSVPRHLAGAAVGAMAFFRMVGLSTAPALLGLLQGAAPTLEGGLQRVFLAGAIALGASLLLIATAPAISAATAPSDGSRGAAQGSR